MSHEPPLAGILGIVALIVAIAALVGIIEALRTPSPPPRRAEAGRGEQQSQQSQRQPYVPPSVRDCPPRRADPHAFDHLVGVDEAVAVLREALDWPAQLARWRQQGIQPIRGILLAGPPGTGKTALARAAGWYCGWQAYIVDGPSLLAGARYVGVAEDAVRRLFAAARATAPSLIIFDEIDAVARRRDAGHLNRPADLVLPALLSEMDGVQRHLATPVIIIGTTNREDLLDPALLRPGRIDRIVRLSLPGPQARAALIARRLAGRPAAADVRPDYLARLAEGMSPAEIVAAVDRAVVRAEQEGREVTQADLERELRRGSGMPAGRPRSVQDIWRDVESLVGLGPVKQWLKEVAATVEVSRRRLEQGLPPLVQSLHMAFLGNPGTGKTTVARLAGELLAALSALPGGHVVICRGGDLTDAEAVRAVAQRALGGVLFVDEAHSVPNRPALSELVSAMEQHRDRLCVILAGYEREMAALFRADPGLESRVAFVCRFPDYTPEECLEIARREAARVAFRLSPDAEQALLARFRSVDLGAVGNGRYARRLVEAAIRRQAVRVAEGRAADLVTLEACDFEGVE